MRCLDPLTNMAGLKSPDLSCTFLRCADLSPLAKLTGLADLDLGRTLVDDDGLEHLAGLSALRTLDLRSTRVTGLGLAHIPLAGLRQLGLSGSWVTADECDRLRAVYVGKTFAGHRFKSGHHSITKLLRPQYEGREKWLYLARLVYRQAGGVELPLEWIHERAVAERLLGSAEGQLIFSLDPELNDKDEPIRHSKNFAVHNLANRTSVLLAPGWPTFPLMRRVRGPAARSDG